MVLLAAGSVHEVTVGHLWWKRKVWTGFCGCTWIGHAWRTKPGAKSELRDHMIREHPLQGETS